MIIVGTRGVSYKVGGGEFHCPTCGPQTYKRKRVRKFFTLYFVPLLPLDSLGEYVECHGCNDTYRPAVLGYDPNGEQPFEAEFRIAVRRVLALMALADGTIAAPEIAAICQVYERAAGRSIAPQTVQAEIELAQDDDRTVEEYLGSMLGLLNDQGKELILQASLVVAGADNDFQKVERDLLWRIARALQMQPTRVRKILDGRLTTEPAV